MRKCKLAIVLALGLMMSFAFFNGCAGKKKVVEKPAPVRKAPERKPAPTPRIQEAPRRTDDTITVPSNVELSTVYFDFDKSNIRSNQRSTINDNAALMSKYSTIRIRIEGHCDERGSDEYNLALGQRRADSAKQFLTGYGISSSRITTRTYGESRPVSSGHNETAWAQNRRCEFIITSK